MPRLDFVHTPFEISAYYFCQVLLDVVIDDFPQKKTFQDSRVDAILNEGLVSDFDSARKVLNKQTYKK